MAWYECHLSRLSGADHWLISAQVLGDQAQALRLNPNTTATRRCGSGAVPKMKLWLISSLLLAASLTKASHTSARNREEPHSRALLSRRDRTILARALNVDRWFEDRRLHPRPFIVGHVRSRLSRQERNATPWTPATWRVSKAGDVPEPWEVVSGSNHAKQVFRATFHDAPVIVKKKHRDPSGHDAGGGLIYMELLYLEALRGEPGVPDLLGAWVDKAHITYVVGDCGAPIGAGAGSAADPTVVSPAFARRAAVRQSTRRDADSMAWSREGLTHRSTPTGGRRTTPSSSRGRSSRASAPGRSPGSRTTSTRPSSR